MISRVEIYRLTVCMQFYSPLCLCVRARVCVCILHLAHLTFFHLVIITTYIQWALGTLSLRVKQSECEADDSFVEVQNECNCKCTTPVCLYCLHMTNFNKCYMKTTKYDAPNYRIVFFFGLVSLFLSLSLGLFYFFLLKTCGRGMGQIVNATAPPLHLVWVLDLLVVSETTVIFTESSLYVRWSRMRAGI